jgi:hypothetical protein
MVNAKPTLHSAFPCGRSAKSSLPKSGSGVLVPSTVTHLASATGIMRRPDSHYVRTARPDDGCAGAWRSGHGSARRDERYRIRRKRPRGVFGKASKAFDKAFPGVRCGLGAACGRSSTRSICRKPLLADAEIKMKAFVSSGRDFIAFLFVCADTTDIRHEYARLARYIGADIP